MNHAHLQETISMLVFEVLGKFNLQFFKQLSANNVRPETKEQEQDFAWTGKQHPEITYAQKTLPYLGRGSSRITFAYSGGKALKIAVNRSGLGQNQAELQIFTAASGNDLVTKIFDYDPNYKWIIAEIVKPFEGEEGQTEFEALTGIPAYEFYGLIGRDPDQYLQDIYVQLKELNQELTDIKNEPRPSDPYQQRLYGQRLENASNSKEYYEKMAAKYEQILNPKSRKFLKDLEILMTTHKVEKGDVVVKHFGKTVNNEVRFYDYGYTEEVRHKYYS